MHVAKELSDIKWIRTTDAYRQVKTHEKLILLPHPKSPQQQYKSESAFPPLNKEWILNTKWWQKQPCTYDIVSLQINEGQHAHKTQPGEAVLRHAVLLWQNAGLRRVVWSFRKWSWRWIVRCNTNPFKRDGGWWNSSSHEQCRAWKCKACSLMDGLMDGCITTSQRNGGVGNVWNQWCWYGRGTDTATALKVVAICHHGHCFFGSCWGTVIWEWLCSDVNRYWCYLGYLTKVSHQIKVRKMLVWY